MEALAGRQVRKSSDGFPIPKSAGEHRSAFRCVNATLKMCACSDPEIKIGTWDENSGPFASSPPRLFFVCFVSFYRFIRESKTRVHGTSKLPRKSAGWTNSWDNKVKRCTTLVCELQIRNQRGNHAAKQSQRDFQGTPHSFVTWLHSRSARPNEAITATSERRISSFKSESERICANGSHFSYFTTC